MTAAIIVAAGSGSRMKNKTPKQYLHLAGIPIISRTLGVFFKSASIDRIILVIPGGQTGYFRKDILGKTGPAKPIQLIAGGTSRQESVFNGLRSVDAEAGDELVVIHDGVRPFADIDLIESCILEAGKSGACVCGIPAHDTLKQVLEPGKVNKTIDRETVWMTQTPQVFRYDTIMKAHENARDKGVKGSDDAFLVEQAGYPVTIINGHPGNIKITTPEDLLIAEAIYRSKTR